MLHALSPPVIKGGCVQVSVTTASESVVILNFSLCGRSQLQSWLDVKQHGSDFCKHQTSLSKCREMMMQVH